MPKTWEKALKQYSYPVDLTKYCDANKFPDHFKQNILGDRESTIKFEDYFRKNSQIIEPWFEVVYWKMYSQHQVSDSQTCSIVERFKNQPNLPTILLMALDRFMMSETFEDSKKNFDTYRKLFRYSSSAIATVATFPAFLNPDKFPMVDTRVAKWVNSQYSLHNKNDPQGPQLILSAYGRTSNTNVLTMVDFNFYYNWILWTRHMARKLSARTNFHWRARDVEMAIFTAWGRDPSRTQPYLKLNPI